MLLLVLADLLCSSLISVDIQVFVVGATLSNWDVRYLHLGPDAAYTGSYFYANWMTTVLYFIVDLIWVSRVPMSVKNPGTIIKVCTLLFGLPLAVVAHARLLVPPESTTSSPLRTSVDLSYGRNTGGSWELA